MTTETRDLVERLELLAAWHCKGGPTPDQKHPSTHHVASEAAATITRLTEEVEGRSLLDSAVILATRLHAGQVDKGGQPYILHPLRVMLTCQGEQERIAAVLHDTMEDCGLSWASIAERFGKDIADAVDALSRCEDEDYATFIDRCAQNPIARFVKLADIADNMDLRRLGREPTAEDACRQQRYAAARATLARSGGDE